NLSGRYRRNRWSRKCTRSNQRRWSRQPTWKRWTTCIASSTSSVQKWKTPFTRENGFRFAKPRTIRKNTKGCGDRTGVPGGELPHIGVCFEVYNESGDILCKEPHAMMRLKKRFIVDENGTRIGVLLDIEDYQRVLAELEELEAIRAYDAAKTSG